MAIKEELIKSLGNDVWLDPRVYSDEGIFELEMERLFHNLWVYVGHESEFRSVGDFKVSRVGRFSVLLIKGSDGRVRGFINKCTHRGNILCRNFKGNAKFFKCIYHGWVFNTEGKLIGVPDREGFPRDYNFEKLNLREVNVQEYKGLIFASIKPKISLEEHLGDTKIFIDYIFDIAQNGIEVKGPVRYAYPGNWKLVVENTLDMYHFPVLHESVAMLSEYLNNKSPRRLAQSALSGVKKVDVAFNGVGYLRRGHGFVAVSRDLTNLRDQLDSITSYEKLEEIFGKSKAKYRNSTTFHVYIFPNLLIHDFDNTVPTLRVIYPISVGLTEIESYTFFPKDAPLEVKRKILRAHEEVRGAVGMSNADDNEIMGVVHFASLMEEPKLFIMKGKNREVSENKMLEEAGINIEGASYSLDDTFIRGFYKWWKMFLLE
jgi:phenylpropionate dioxygenase-like ring-hydroxylating dioxygenase large terminal subunit